MINNFFSRARWHIDRPHTGFNHRFAVLIVMLLSLGIGNMWGADHTWSYTFASGNIPTSAGSSTYTGKIDGSTNKGVTWTRSALTANGWSADKGVQLGTAKNPQKSSAWTMQTAISNIGSNIKITSITVNISVASSGGGNYILSAGTASSGSTAFNNTSAGNKTYNITTDITTGNIVISLQSTKDKAMYIKSVTIGYSDVASTYTVVNAGMEKTEDKKLENSLLQCLNSCCKTAFLPQCPY